jgi:8-amino-7-oxononanoate synthase
MLSDKLKNKLIERANQNSLRSLSVKDSLIDFSSNDYLGLAKNRKLYEYTQAELQKKLYNINGSTGSRLISGNSEYAEELERLLASFFKAEHTLIFNSGFSANTSLLSSVAQRGDTILYDERIHASIKDGARLSLAHRHSFRHNDPEDLKKKIARASGDVYVVIESIYSMDGDRGDIENILAVCEDSGAYLIVDEAHSTGIYGKHGNGICCERNIERKIFARVYTFGKAMGIHGACIAGDKQLIEYLINFARPFIYTTFLPPHSLASIYSAIHIMPEVEVQNERKKLFENITFYKKATSHICKSYSSLIRDCAIQIVNISGNIQVKKISNLLEAEGLDVRPILPPTVPVGKERLRICLHSYNTQEQIEKLVAIIDRETI